MALSVKNHPNLKAFINFWVFVFERFKVDGCFSTAAALAFASVLSIVPLMTVGLSVLRIIPFIDQLGQQATDFIFSNFVPATGEIVQKYLQTFIQQSSQLTGVGTIFLIVTAFMMLVTMENALNGIWRVPTQRKGLAAFVVYWAILTLAPLLVVGSVGLSSYFFSVNFFLDISYGQPSRWLAGYLPFLMTTTGFTFLYLLMPNCHVKVKHALIGGIVAACLFELSKRGFSLYIANFHAYQLLYGALATFPIFLFWIYLAWVVVLFGAEVTNALSYDHRESRSGSGHNFIVSYVWIHALWEAQKEGKGVSLGKLMLVHSVASTIEVDQIIRALLKAYIIRHATSGEFVLARNLSHLTLYELYALLPWQIPHPSELKKIDPKLLQMLKTILETTDLLLRETLAKPVAEYFPTADDQSVPASDNKNSDRP